MDRQFINGFDVFVTDSGIVRIVSRAIVKEKDLVDFFPDLVWNPIECPVEFVDGVIGNHKNAYTLLRVGKGRRGFFGWDGHYRSQIVGELPSPALHRSEEHTSELQSQSNLVCRLLL